MQKIYHFMYFGKHIHTLQNTEKENTGLASSLHNRMAAVGDEFVRKETGERFWLKGYEVVILDNVHVYFMYLAKLKNPLKNNRYLLTFKF